MPLDEDENDDNENIQINNLKEEAVEHDPLASETRIDDLLQDEMQTGQSKPQQVTSGSDAKSEDEDGGADDEPWLEACHRQKLRMRRARLVLVLSCISIVVSGLLFCYYGEKYLNQSFISVKEGLRKIQKLCQGGVYVVDRFTARLSVAVDRNEKFFTEINGVYPGLREQLCQVVDDNRPGESVTIGDCTLQDLPYVNQSLALILDALYRSKEYLSEEVNGFRDDLLELYDEIETFLNGNSNLEWTFWISFSFTIALVVCCCWMVIGMYFHPSFKKGGNEFILRRRLLFPLFCFLALVAYAFSVAFIIAAVGASDWCINSPDVKVTHILESNEEKLDSIIYRWAKYYVNQCNDDLFPLTLNPYLNAYVEMMTRVEQFSNDLESVDNTVWTEVCGRDTRALYSLTDWLKPNMCFLGVTLSDINRFLWCRAWNPVYTVLMHDAICYDVSRTLGVFCLFPLNFERLVSLTGMGISLNFVGSKWVNLGCQYHVYNCGVCLCCADCSSFGI